MLTEGGKPLRVGGRALDILIALVQRHGEVVGKSELLKLVWPNTFVEEDNLKVHVSALAAPVSAILFQLRGAVMPLSLRLLLNLTMRKQSRRLKRSEPTICRRS
jgi:hypothetical protein